MHWYLNEMEEESRLFTFASRRGEAVEAVQTLITRLTSDTRFTVTGAGRRVAAPVHRSRGIARARLAPASRIQVPVAVLEIKKRRQWFFLENGRSRAEIIHHAEQFRRSKGKSGICQCTRSAGEKRSAAK